MLVGLLPSASACLLNSAPAPGRHTDRNRPRPRPPARPPAYVFIHRRDFRRNSCGEGVKAGAARAPGDTWDVATPVAEHTDCTSHKAMHSKAKGAGQHVASSMYRRRQGRSSEPISVCRQNVE